MGSRSEIPIAVLKEYFRVPTPNLPVNYEGREMLLACGITNLSAHGAFVRTAKPLAQGTEVDIAFFLPGQASEVVATAVVRWSSRATPARSEGAAAPVGMGLEFIKISAKHRRLVEKYVEDFLERMRR